MNRSEITLLKDERILWEQSMKKNLLGFNKFIAFPIISMSFLFLMGAIVLIEFIWATIYLVVFIVIGIIGLIWSTLYTNRKKRRVLKLSNEELRNYEVFDILTNQRYIRRNYDFNFRRDYSAYPADILEMKEDVFLLKLSSLSRVLFFFRDNIIGLEPKGFEADQNFAIKFQKDKVSEFPAVRETLINLLELEFNDGKMGYIEFYHTKLF